MSVKSIEEKTAKLALKVLEGFPEIELWDVEYVKEGSDFYLRVFIDKEGGVDIDDCVNVTHPMNELLDKEDFIKDAYIFEVSSPGLDRPLKKDKDFERNIGKHIELKLFAPVNGSKEYDGILKGFDKDAITVEINGEDSVFIREKIALVRQYIEF